MFKALVDESEPDFLLLQTHLDRHLNARGLLNLWELKLAVNSEKALLDEFFRGNVKRLDEFMEWLRTKHSEETNLSVPQI